METNQAAAQTARRVERIEWTLSILLSAVVLFLIVMRTSYAGPLWRDECDCFYLARMPHFQDLLDNLQYTAFPIVFPLSVRAYTTVFGTTDVALRFFGVAVGILFLAAAWFQSRTLQREPPLLLLALIGLNLNFLTNGLWLRGYGLGGVLIIFALVATARFLRQPNPASLFVVFVCYLVSVQTLFFNGVLVPAIMFAAATVLLLRRQWKWLSLFLVAGGLCGISYIPYIWTLYSSTRTWAVVLQESPSLKLALQQFFAAGGPHSITATVWLGVVFICMIGGALRLKQALSEGRSRERDMLIFGLLIIPISILTSIVFMGVVQNTPLQRYYLALWCLVAAATDLVAANISSSYTLRLGRLGLVIAAVATLLFLPWPVIRQRQSNMDVIAQRIEFEAAPNDLIVVNHASYGISFNRYYHGANHWITVPEIEDHRVHRYDLLYKKMTEFFPIDDVEREISDALKDGHRVWIVGEIHIPKSGRILTLAPAPDPYFGWRIAPYFQAWTEELSLFVQRHAEQTKFVIHRGNLVSDRENLSLYACDGWRY